MTPVNRLYCVCGQRLFDLIFRMVIVNRLSHLSRADYVVLRADNGSLG